MLTVKQSQHLATLMRQVARPGFSRLLIAGLRRSLNCNTVAVILFAQDSMARILDCWVEDRALNRIFHDIYVNGAFRLDPFYHEGRRSRQPRFLRLLDVAPDQFFKTEYFRRYYRQAGFSDEMGFVMPCQNGAVLHLSVSRRGTDRRFSKIERNLLVSLAPLFAVVLEQQYHSVIGATLDTTEPVPIAHRIDRHAREVLDSELTQREALVLQHVLEGYSNASIALLLDVSPLTIKVHRRNAYRKLNISSQAELFVAFLPALTAEGKVSP